MFLIINLKARIYMYFLLLNALHDHFYLKSINKMSLLFITKIECYMIYLNKCFIKAEPNIEFLVVFSGRLGVRLRKDWRETRRRTWGRL